MSLGQPAPARCKEEPGKSPTILDLMAQNRGLYPRPIHICWAVRGRGKVACSMALALLVFLMPNISNIIY